MIENNNNTLRQNTTISTTNTNANTTNTNYNTNTRNFRRNNNNLTCTHCKRKGHIIDKCWIKFPNLRPKRLNNIEQSPVEESINHIATANVVLDTTILYSSLRAGRTSIKNSDILDTIQAYQPGITPPPTPPRSPPASPPGGGPPPPPGGPTLPPSGPPPPPPSGTPSNNSSNDSNHRPPSYVGPENAPRPRRRPSSTPESSDHAPRSRLFSDVPLVVDDEYQGPLESGITTPETDNII